MGLYYTRAMVERDEIETLLRKAFPDLTVLELEDLTGTKDHYELTLVSAQFEGLSLVEQHKLVYAALAAPLADGTIHELRITTRTEGQ